MPATWQSLNEYVLRVPRRSSAFGGQDWNLHVVDGYELSKVCRVGDSLWFKMCVVRIDVGAASSVRAI